MAFRAGRFDRASLPAHLRHLCPTEAVPDLKSVDLAKAVAAGKKLVLLDVDNTLLPWRSRDIPAETREWLEGGKALGLTFCIVSNTRNKERLQHLAHALGIDFVDGRSKPSRRMFRAAMHKHHVTAEETLMIGDQLMTDILGANRSGIEAIWVQPMTRKEFVGTKVNRFAESLVLKRLYEAMESSDDDLPGVPHSGILRSKIARQFLKFCIVGGSSFLIDAGLHNLLMFRIRLHGNLLSQELGTSLAAALNPGATITAELAHDTAFTAFKVVSASLAILNSVVWNRMWTFNIRGKEERMVQLSKFIVVSVIGLVLNTVIASTLNRLLPGDEGRRWLVATVIAAGVVAIWNFSGQRLWAFRKPS
jgi:HAD superfamily phosphatase (TIGR01668 family)